ncbi:MULTISPECIES: DUF6088 family protein [Porphyromonas]|nr:MULTISPECIES: DUF6088 family protein [Porphyromonas]WCF98135.1 DUF6088 family protein [Porphyromonas gingivalis]
MKHLDCHKNIIYLWQIHSHMQSTYYKIKDKIISSERGQLFFPDDFSTLGSSDAVRSALVRLCQNEIILRIAQGIYYYPKSDTKWGSGIIPPSMEEIANSIAKRDKIRIIPVGAYVLNILGLSTQVPANIVFVTDGSPRRISIGKGKGILFKHTSEMRNFAYQSQMMLLIVTALREIGENNVTPEQLEIIKTHLEKVSLEDFQRDIQLAPIWVRKLLQNK